MSGAYREALQHLAKVQPHGSWRRELRVLIGSYASSKADGRALSSRTREATYRALFEMFELLKREGHFKFAPRNLGARHIEWLRAHYAARLAAGTIAASTLHTQFSYLRRFCDETGHRGMVPPIAQLFPEADTRRHLAAQTDKSWSGNGVSFEEVYKRVHAIEPFVAWALLAQCALGLRRREALCFRPHTACIDVGDGSAAQVGQSAQVIQGAKGGRQRVVPIETDMARSAVERLARWVEQRDGGPGGTIGPQLRAQDSLKSNLARYSAVVRAAGISREESGVTGHGLRAQYAMEFLERRAHVVSVRVGPAPETAPVPDSGAARGGESVAGSAGAIADPTVEAARAHADRLALAENLGHSRVSIVTAYTGANAPARPADKPASEAAPPSA